VTQVGLDLPKGWIECRLGDVLNYGATLKAEPEEIPPDAWVLELEDIEKDTSKVLQRATHAERQSKSTKNRFFSGDVLYGKLRPYLNKVVLASESGYCTTEIIPLSPPAGLDGRYLLYWLKHPRFLEYVTAASHGLNMPRLGTDAGRMAPFVLAPLSEQKRIADKLEALLAHVDACRERLNRVPIILKRFRQSVLAAATSGELTREWREARGRTSHLQDWEARTLADLCAPSRVITYGVIKLGNETPNGVPCLRTSNVRWLKIDIDGVKRIAPALSAEFGRTVLQGGEVLVNVRGTLGGVAVVDSTMRGWNVSREVAVVPIDSSQVAPQFLAFWIGSDASQRWLAKVEKGVAYTGINIEDLRTLPVSIPPIDEQMELVRRVQELFELADELEVRHETASRLVGSMTAALLAKAFRGELVAQDPNDEPASELLVRARSTTAEHRKRTKVIRSKSPMSSGTEKDKVKAALLKLKAGRFSFNDLHGQVAGDYDLVKDVLFELLQEPKPVVRQIFDKKAKAMQLVRVKP
jgi:type I restriction enzyme, S subunit